jgi:LmbE family N-acetylglucosaminyl deacetylase
VPWAVAGRQGLRPHQERDVWCQLRLDSDHIAGAEHQGEDLVRSRAEVAPCATQALVIPSPILLGSLDGKLGDCVGDRTSMYRLTQRMADELAGLWPNAVLTWGPDGGVGHPDHPATVQAWNGAILLIPAFQTSPGADLFC